MNWFDLPSLLDLALGSIAACWLVASELRRRWRRAHAEERAAPRP